MKIDVVGQIMAYESGEMNESQTIAFFQHLVDSGLAWRLQGHYGGKAHQMITAGLVSRTPRGGIYQ